MPAPRARGLRRSSRGASAGGCWLPPHVLPAKWGNLFLLPAFSPGSPSAAGGEPGRWDFVGVVAAGAERRGFGFFLGGVGVCQGGRLQEEEEEEGLVAGWELFGQGYRGTGPREGRAGRSHEPPVGVWPVLCRLGTVRKYVPAPAQAKESSASTPKVSSQG